LPPQFGSIRKISHGPSDRVLIHIQDIHLNPEAQHNIGQLLQSLINAGVVDLVVLEGAFGEIDLSRFRQFEDKGSVQKVADYLLKSHKISGAVHTAFTSQKEIPAFVGV